MVFFVELKGGKEADFLFPLLTFFLTLTTVYLVNTTMQTERQNTLGF